MTGGDARDAVEWLGRQEAAMLLLLEEVVNLDSGSYDKEGVDAVGERFRRFFAEEGIPVATHQRDTFGDAITADVTGAGGSNKPIVLLGHRDTVFPKGEAGRRPFRVEDGRAYGPGVRRHEGGLVMNAFVLAAYHRFGGAPAPLIGLITSDEEIGSPPAAASSRTTPAGPCVFNAEPGGPPATSSRRKGGVFMEIEIRKAAHSGGLRRWVSAINEAAHKILRSDVTDIELG
jgi:glutamate carboxypeptidase